MAHCSFLVFNPAGISRVRATISKVGWRAHFTEDPSGRYGFKGYGFGEYSSPDEDYEGMPRRRGRLLVLDGDEEQAQNISDLIRAAGCVNLAWPEDRLKLRSVFPIPRDKDERRSIYQYVFRTPGFFEHFAHHDVLPSAVEIAATAWPERRLTYALHKLHRSYVLESITPHSTEPRFGQVFTKFTPNHASHVNTATAINLAYSAIEELGFQINSSRERPRWKDKATFSWNEEVLEDIETRLRKAGIDPAISINWVVRGDTPDFRVEPVLDVLASHSDGKLVRDQELTIPYAIHACSYIRNYATAHAFGEDVDQLGPYELFNVQQVARFLTLSKCHAIHTGRIAQTSHQA